VRQPIVFVTDYGRDDAYAAALVGAAWRVDPHAICLEGTHGVPPGDVLAGAYHLKSLALAFADGAVFCAVLDPEVGTERRAIVIEVGRIRCVAPDNGLVSYLWDEAAAPSRRAVRLDVPVEASPTFHGRDVFAPAAAELASGTRLAASGEPIDDPIVLADAFAERLGNGLRGRVAVIDHFGNAITTIRAADIGAASIRSVSWQGGAVGGMVTTYRDIDTGVAALIGSAGHLEISGRGRPAADAGGPRLGDSVAVELG
jgi:S-adenosyl-L-methionine hydrolase (adenosine-forming)